MENLVLAQIALHPCGRYLAAQGPGDSGDVVIDHALVSAFVAARRAHGIREKLAADSDRMAT